MSGQRPITASSAAGAMQQEWEQRARENARFYICTDVPSDDASFFASGAQDYDRHVRPFLQAQAFDPQGKTALEIGCGMGRMTAVFAQEFGEVVGIDVSPEMVQKARARGVPGARYLLGSGCDLAGVADSSVDFVFSYIVFQHIPEEAMILRYFEEAGRVLRPGGLFRLHVNGLPHVDIGGILLEGYLSASPRLPAILRGRIPFIRRRRLSTWLGHPAPLSGVRAVCKGSGLEITEVTGKWTAEMWVSGRREEVRI